MATGTTVQITLPQMGESVTEGTILEWLKQVGDAVEEDEGVVEVSTDKVDTEVPAPAAGVITAIYVQPDETVPTGTVLGEIDVSGNGGGSPPPAAAGGGPDVGSTGGMGANDGAADDGMSAADESAVEEAEHGADAEESYQAAVEETTPGRPGAGGDGATGEVVDVHVPQMGESVSEGTVLEWLKQVGDRVEVDEGIVEISTDKVDAELPSPVAGTLVEILAGPDEVVQAGSVVARIAVGDGQKTEDRGQRTEGAPVSGAVGEAAPARQQRAATNGDSNATPVAERMASAHGVDTSRLTGTGPRGKVTKADVENALAGNGATAGGTASSEPRAASPPVETRPPAPGAKPIRGPAATLARFMNESRSIPTATSFRTLEVATLDSTRRALKAAGQRLSFTHLIAWAIVQAWRDFPVMGHSYAEADGKPQRVDPGSISLGLAVDVERKDGTRSLVVPVLKNADAMEFPDFVARYDELVAGARDNKLPPDDYMGANVSLTNPGGLGTVASVPRLMPGQGTIVATGSIAYPPGFSKTDPARLRDLGVSKVMTMTSTYDHRVIQGAESGSFLRRVDQLLQGDDGFYDGVFRALGVDHRAEAPAAAPTGDGAVTAHEPAPLEHKPDVTGAPDEALLQAVQAATSIVKAHRMHGHLAATLDPLGSEPPGDPALDPATVGLTRELMAQIPASVLRVAVPGETFADALPHLKKTYCGPIAYEIEHISDHEQRVWLRQTVESGEHFRPSLGEKEKKRLLHRLSEVEALEAYLHKAFLGKKQFSIEGLDMAVPMLDEMLQLASAAGAREVVIGMAHRGRLNVLAHTVGRPYESILVEFEGEQNIEADTAQPEGGTGDVKYHHGAAGTYKTLNGKSITVTLSPNPSHLEFVDPVVEGRARADQTSRKGRRLEHDPTLVVPVLLHGDAAFPGQGVVAETLNLQALEGYTTGGTVHLITNNQLGFTTDPDDSRSTRYASDLAKGFDVPIVHVNADDVEACIAAVRLCMAFREKFGRDALIDLVGYRRFGHNETDEPAYTQPQMYEVIKKHPPVRKLYAEQLVSEGVLTEAVVEEYAAKAYSNVQAAHARLKESMAESDDGEERQLDRSASPEPRTAVGADTLRSLNEQLLRVPDGFNVHRKLGPQLERRRKAFEDGGALDWAHAESLAWASLLQQGVPIRLTGQDTERGTFSQRHLKLHDAKTGDGFVPIQHLAGAEAPFELHNSPLSEAAALGFEYGYSAQAPEALVLWEAQFGDFVNGAQVIIDQFIVSALAKWGQTTRLTLLLPHGYEGAGPEHSSGRVERFLQLGAEGNIRVANCTTPGQYFHLLRRQALIQKRRPLVVMTPKSLLRLPAAASPLSDLAEGRFQPVLDDPTLPGSREDVTRLVLCTGKVFYDIVASEERAQSPHVAVARVELLYPFAENELRELMASYPNLKTVVWAQEEPKNMGARAIMEPRLAWILPDGIGYEYEGRQLRASPGEGYTAAHRAEQGRIVRAALGAGRG
jgi:multifunctional 2-oxoglutarate metabolism enzyme